MEYIAKQLSIFRNTLRVVGVNKPVGITHTFFYVKVKVCSYIAQYPVLGTAQIA